MERLQKYIDLKVNLTAICTVVILIVSWAMGYQELKSNHIALANEVHAHFNEDRGKFDTLATKETGVVRDKALDQKLDEIIRRLERIERLHMK
jgi:hypothetical protein